MRAAAYGRITRAVRPGAAGSTALSRVSELFDRAFAPIWNERESFEIAPGNSEPRIAREAVPRDRTGGFTTAKVRPFIRLRRCSRLRPRRIAPMCLTGP